MQKIYGELILWETIKKDCKYPDDDDNSGYEYGINYIDFEGEGDIYEVEWFKTEEERLKRINEEGITIVFD